jgi:hypothetical protein
LVSETTLVEASHEEDIMKSRWLATLLVFTVCGGWLALASPPSPTPTPGLQIQTSAPALQIKTSSKALTFPELLRFNCPTMSYAGQPKVEGSEAASWTPTGLTTHYIKAKQVIRRDHPAAGSDSLLCRYSAENVPLNTHATYTAAQFFVSRLAPTTHPICKAINPKSFECRRLKPGETYSATLQY